VVLSGEDTALVAIDSLEVQVTAGGATGKRSIAELKQSLVGSQTGKGVVVRLTNTSSGWKISGRPLKGWSAENIWLIGNIE